MADLSIDIFDATTTGETTTLGDSGLVASVVDTVSTTESFSDVIGWDVSVIEATTSSESLEYYTDSVGALEQVTLGLVDYQGFSTADFAATTESVSLSPVPNPMVQELVNVSDILSTYPDLVSVEDVVISVAILNPFETLVSDLTTVSENVSASVVSSFSTVNPKKRIAEVTDPQIIRIERL